MRGYILSFEAILSAILVFLLLAFVFLPLPTTYSITSYVAANDRVVALLESCFPAGDCVPQSNRCIDYRHVFTPSGELIPVCVPP